MNGQTSNYMSRLRFTLGSLAQALSRHPAMFLQQAMTNIVLKINIKSQNDNRVFAMYWRQDWPNNNSIMIEREIQDL